MANNKIISIVVVSVLLIAAVVASIAVVAVHRKQDKDAATEHQLSPSSIKTIQAFCQPSIYKQTCEEELTRTVGNNDTDTKSLIRATFNVSIAHIRKAANESTVITAASNDPTTVLPLEECGKLFDSAVADLEDAINHMMEYELSDLPKGVTDIKNWLSAAHTYQDNCLDEFTNKTSDAAMSMKKALNRSMELTANAIQIVHEVGAVMKEFDIASIFGIGGSRRLLEADGEGIPSWVPERQSRLLEEAGPLQGTAVVVVAEDGSGQFRTIKEGLDHMPRNNKDYVVMYIKEGLYHEVLTVESDLNMLVLVGDGPNKTRISGSLSVGKGQGIGTVQSSTFSVISSDFMARDIGFLNEAGPEGLQAVAFRSQSDHSVLYNCHFDGYQDTLYAQSKRQFYRDCTISGTIDFIFGNAQAIFQNCVIVLRKPLSGQQNIVTAHGSTVDNENTMYVLHNCTITAEPSLLTELSDNPSYLGRPWKPRARTIIMQSQLDMVINPDGWLPWENNPDSINTCYFAEIGNRGVGADLSRRVSWPGFKNLTPEEAVEKYTLDGLYEGGAWVKSSGAPFFAGMLP